MDDKEKRRIAARRRYAENPEKYKAINKAKYVANPDVYLNATRRWKDENPEAYAEQRRKQYKNRKIAQRAFSAFVGARNRAKLKNMEFDLTREWVESRGNVCELSGLPFRPEYDGVHDRNPFAQSVDRIDNKRGYTQDNCRLILSCLNMGMGQWGLEEVAPIWRAVLSRLPE